MYARSLKLDNALSRWRNVFEICTDRGSIIAHHLEASVVCIRACPRGFYTPKHTQNTKCALVTWCWRDGRRQRRWRRSRPCPDECGGKGGNTVCSIGYGNINESVTCNGLYRSDARLVPTRICHKHGCENLPLPGGVVSSKQKHSLMSHSSRKRLCR